MKHLLIAAAILFILFQLGGLLWLSNNHGNTETFARLLDPPPRSIQNPYQNGYFYLFGLTTAPLLDPAKTGYEIWVEESGDFDRESHEGSKSSRAKLDLGDSLESAAEIWNLPDPLLAFKKGAINSRPSTGPQRILLSRYERWLGLPFEDWGFGRRVPALNREIVAVHRLYVAAGFALGSAEGFERLRKDLLFWRFILRESKTIGTKVLAQVIITDDLQLLSKVLARPLVDNKILSTGMQVTLPLSESDHSLRWPIKHQLALAVRESRASVMPMDESAGARTSEEEWLISAANLPSHAFEAIKHPYTRSFLSVLFNSSEAWDTYAAYYEALINASESRALRLPRMREITGDLNRGLMEQLFNPVPVEPDWNLFHRQLTETDTRLRLASLQIQLRRPNPLRAIPTRLAQVGSDYYDPFTGLPMLWSPTQQKVYSTGPDRLDDGGDPTFDISVPAIVSKPGTH
ncbi:hypothetical protein [Petrachloros mirabilis]